MRGCGGKGQADYPEDERRRRPNLRWQSNLPPMGSVEEAELVKAGKVKPEQTRFYPANSSDSKESACAFTAGPCNGMSTASDG